MKVWLLYSGDNETFGVLGIFTSEENARKVWEKRGSANDEPIVARETDEMVDWEYGPVFSDSINMETGKIHSWTDDYIFRHPTQCVIRAVNDSYGTWRLVESPLSHGDARQVAVKAREEWLRTRGTTPPPPSRSPGPAPEPARQMHT